VQLPSTTPTTISSTGSLTRGAVAPQAPPSNGAQPSSSSFSQPAGPSATSRAQESLPGERVSIQRPVGSASAPSDTGNEARRPGDGSSRPDARGNRPQSAGERPDSGRQNRNEPSEPGSQPTPGSQSRQDNDNNSGGLSPEQRSEIRELRSRDLEVRQHEQAHQAVGGQFAGSVNFTFERGPNGQLFAVGGQVSIDTSPVPDDPEATINKMQVVRAAALAPAEPSSQDIQVAQEATSQMLEARAELRAERREEVNGGSESSPDSASREPDSNDARIDLFRNVDGFSDTSRSSENGSRFAAIA